MTDLGSSFIGSSFMSTSTRQRGGCLSLFLLVLVVFALYNLISSFGLQQAYQDLAAQGLSVEVIVPSWLVPAQIVISVLTLACIYGIFTWKKWGVYGLVLLWAIGLGIGAASIGIAPMAVLILGIQVLLLAVALRGRWAYFG
jgi:hypothetical protein